MKNFLWFIIGLLCGIFVMMLNESNNESVEQESEEIVIEENIEAEEAAMPLTPEPQISHLEGLTLFDTPQGNVPVALLQIGRIYPSGEAIATEVENIGNHYIDRDIKVLLIPKEGEHFYSNQIVSISSNQRLSRVGEFKNGYKIYPAVKLINR